MPGFIQFRYEMVSGVIRQSMRFSTVKTAVTRLRMLHPQVRRRLQFGIGHRDDIAHAINQESDKPVSIQNYDDDLPVARSFTAGQSARSYPRPGSRSTKIDHAPNMKSATGSGVASVHRGSHAPPDVHAEFLLTEAEREQLPARRLQCNVLAHDLILLQDAFDRRRPACVR